MQAFWHFMAIYGILAFLPKSRIGNQIRFFQFYPIFRLFPTSRLSDSTALILTLLPDPNLTRYPVFCPIPDPTWPDIEKLYPLGTAYNKQQKIWQWHVNEVWNKTLVGCGFPHYKQVNRVDPRDGGDSELGPWDVSHGTFQCNRHGRLHGLIRVSSDINVVQSCTKTSYSYNLQNKLGANMICHKVREDPTDRGVKVWTAPSSGTSRI